MTLCHVALSNHFTIVFVAQLMVITPSGVSGAHVMAILTPKEHGIAKALSMEGNAMAPPKKSGSAVRNPTIL